MARDLRHRVAIQHNVESRTKGVRMDNWLTLETVFARIKTMGGMEMVRGQQGEGLFTHEVEIRYRDDLGAGDVAMLPRYRLQFGTRVFNIHSVIHPYPGNDRTVMRVKEVVT